jgi:tetratricopeptide (TPR) repeat protein
MIRWLAMLTLTTAPLTGAEAVADRLTLAGVAEFNAAYHAWDGARFAQAADLFRQATTHAPASPTPFYWLGTAQFHRLLHLRSSPASAPQAEAAEAALEAALAALNRAVRLDPRHAEAHALLGTLYGMKMGGNLLLAARFGARVEKHRTRALQEGAQDPRVHYLLGVCQFQTAKQARTQREALRTLLEADRLFRAEASAAAGPLAPRWGHASCLTFIGQTYEQLGEPGRAAEFFRQALARHPADRRAQEGLARVAAGK